MGNSFGTRSRRGLRSNAKTKRTRQQRELQELEHYLYSRRRVYEPDDDLGRYYINEPSENSVRYGKHISSANKDQTYYENESTKRSDEEKKSENNV
ncbi:hypothetical protein OWV82_012329 [Melia azedarach]|uniref:Uncharacterized protein n=1 Tax=Melia azedarach TaxID=155640 RepID=A0ACC1Y2R5_MELAZ|nr:hypothetical protein OWV82_012329 [Melia azedarach]